VTWNTLRHQSISSSEHIRRTSSTRYCWTCKLNILLAVNDHRDYAVPVNGRSTAVSAKERDALMGLWCLQHSRRNRGWCRLLLLLPPVWQSSLSSRDRAFPEARRHFKRRNAWSSSSEATVLDTNQLVVDRPECLHVHSTFVRVTTAYRTCHDTASYTHWPLNEHDSDWIDSRWFYHRHHHPF